MLRRILIVIFAGLLSIQAAAGQDQLAAISTPDDLPLDPRHDGWTSEAFGEAAKEICPVWPGQPLNAHWEIPDPAAVEGSQAEIGAAFSEAFRMLSQRISIFVNLPLEALDRIALQKRIDEIDRTAAAAAPVSEMGGPQNGTPLSDRE